MITGTLSSWRITSYVTKSKDAAETASCLQWFMPPHQKLWLMQTVQRSSSNHAKRLQWTHDTNTPQRSENQWYHRKSCPTCKKDRTATATVQRGFRQKGWDRAMEGCCYLRNVHDKMAGVKTACEIIFGVTF